MKLLTKEQEQAHYHATLQGGFIGGGTGLTIGTLGVLAASRRYHFFRQLTLPLKAFLVTSSATFGGIVTADHYSRRFEKENNPIDQEYEARQREQAQASSANKTFTERAMDFGRKERYKIVGASWIASMIAAFAIVNRNKYLSGQQKLVQARVYAQFLTVGVLVATAAFEISDRNNETGRYETIQVIDPNDPEHKKMIKKSRYVDESDGDTMWKDMVAAEEQRMKEREEDENRLRSSHQSKHKKTENADKKGKEGKDDKKTDKKEGDKKNEKKDEGKDDKKADKKEEEKGEEKSKGDEKKEKSKK